MITLCCVYVAELLAEQKKLDTSNVSEKYRLDSPREARSVDFDSLSQALETDTQILPGSTNSYIGGYSDSISNLYGLNPEPKTVLKLHKAAKRRSIETIRTMAAKSQNCLQVQDYAGNTLLHKLMKSDNFDDQAMAESLLEDEQLDFDVNVQDGKGKTLLHVALEKPNTKLADTLMALGADPNIPDKDGNTVLSYLVNGRYFDEYRYFFRQYENMFDKRMTTNREAIEKAELILDRFSSPSQTS